MKITIDGEIRLAFIDSGYLHLKKCIVKRKLNFKLKEMSVVYWKKFLNSLRGRVWRKYIISQINICV